MCSAPVSRDHLSRRHRPPRRWRTLVTVPLQAPDPPRCSMCRPDAPPTLSAAPAVREEVHVPLPTGEELPALYAHPDPAGPGAPQAGGPAGARRPGVVIVADVYGRTPFYEDLAVRLAGEGFHALLPDGFFRQGALAERTREAAVARRGRLDDLRALADFSAAVDWLRGRPEVAGGRTGTIGFCMGGTFVLNLADRKSTRLNSS